MEIREELKSEFIDNLQQLQIEGNYNELVHLIDSNRNIKEDTYEYYKSKLIEFRVKRVLSMQNLYREIGEVIEKIDRNKFPGLWGSLVWEQLRQSLRPSVDIKAIKELIDFYKSLSKLDVNSKSIFFYPRLFLFYTKTMSR